MNLDVREVHLVEHCAKWCQNHKPGFPYITTDYENLTVT